VVSDEQVPAPAAGDHAVAQDALYLAAGVAVVVGGATFRGIMRITDFAMRTLPRAPDPVGSTVVALAARGRDATASAFINGRAMAEDIAREFTRQPEFIGLVNNIVDAVLPGAIDRALPVVMEKLAAEPESVRALVFSQSTGVAGEVVATVRSGVRTGDAAVDRSIRLWRRRREAPEVGRLTLEPGTP
jgi:hypothetical protein